MELDETLKIIGTVTVIAGAIFALRKLYQWVFPIKVTPTIHWPSDDLNRGAISAQVINRSSEAIFVVRCDAIGVRSKKHIIYAFKRRPFTPTRLYRNIFYGAMRFELLNEDPQKIEPYQPKIFEHRLSSHPLSFFDTSEFKIEVQLSSGRVVRSRKMMVPKLWGWEERLKSAASKNS